MLVAIISIRVKPEHLEAFTAATVENARNSIQEAGVVRFDVIQQADDPTRFMLYEVYRTDSDVAKHRETAHYQTWRDTVADMMAEPRSRVEFRNVFPDDASWA